MRLQVKKNGLLYKALTTTVYVTKDRSKASDSEFEYLQTGDEYHLRVLGIINWRKVRLMIDV